MPGIHSHQRFCDLASDEIARLATAADGADPATPVPTCGRWTMADLVQHIGHVHRWAAAMVTDLSRSRPLHGDGERLHLLANDHPGPWTIVRQRTTFTWVHNGPEDQGDAAAPTATVRAPTADLYRFLWGRRRPGHPGLTVTGDAALLTHWQRRAVI
jgi:hypothetical protein